ncbi:MAG TPA: hypothetical protein VFF33_00425 [Ignavibacteriaceae bacterium]|nr:hypothetical protein [Ignavibacteriaceae bacterium]
MKKLILLLLFISTSILAQDSTESFWFKNVKVSGTAGLFGELYSIKGQVRRRPPSTYRLYVQPTFTFFNLFSVPLNLFVSSEGSAARQEINRYGITPQWSWGKAYIGDFSESFSEYSLGEINIRGGGFNINPGIFQFAAVAGLTSRAVLGGNDDGSYDRFLAGAKIGIGKEESSYFNLIFLKAKDKPSSNTGGEFIQVLFPNGSDEVPLNSVQTIRWSSSGFNGDVKIELSKDGGVTYTLVTAQTPNTGAYSWVVNELESFNSKIKISSIERPSIQDESDYSFRLYNGTILVEGNIPIEIRNTYAVTPQENLIIGTKGQLSLFEDRILFSVDASGSAFTKDINAQEVSDETSNLPKAVKSIFIPRISSNFDYAYTTQLKASFQPVDFTVAYKRVGPGYNSLGLPYIMNDQQEILTSVSVGIMPYFISLNYSRVSDNLLDQKLFTTIRNQFGLMISGQVVSGWNSSLMTNILGMGNNSSNDTTKTDFNTFLLSLNNMFSVNYGILSSITFTYSYQGSDNKTILSKNNSVKVHSGNLNFNLSLIENLTGGISLGLISSSYAATSSSTQMYGLFLSHMGISNRLNTSLNLNFSKQQENSILGTNLTSTYRLTERNSVSLGLSYNGYNSLLQDFTELRANLNLRHNF